jgi:hypothetical protein
LVVNWHVATRLLVVCFMGLGLRIRQALAGKLNRFIQVDGVSVPHREVVR